MKNNVKNATLTKLDSLSKKCSNCPPSPFTQACNVGIENKKSFAETKPVPELNAWKFDNSFSPR